MYRITLAGYGMDAREAESRAQDITEEFRHRPWHQNVGCVWDGSRLVLHAENDYDSDARALMDEFSDAITECVEPFDGDIKVLSVTAFE